MPHQIFECDYCNFKDQDEEVVQEHEKEHIQEIEVTQVRSDGEEIASTLFFSVQKDGRLHLTFKIPTEDSSRTYRYMVPAEGYKQLRNIQEVN